MKLLIAYDGSECSDAALLDLRLAGLPREAEALVFTVEESWLPPPAMATVLAPPDASAPPERLEAALTLAFRGCTRLRAHFSAWNVHAAADEGSPAGLILEKAEEFAPDLLVVGSHGMSALEHLVLGSVSQRIVNDARCSVRVARGRVDDDERPVRIGVGFDGSPGALEAVRAVARRTWPEGSEALLLTVYDPSSDVKGEPEAIERLQSRAESVLNEAGIALTRMAAPGDPKRLVPERARAWGADCIFVGSRGHGRLKRLLFGSVATAVASRAHCSVEVIRPPRSVDQTSGDE